MSIHLFRAIDHLKKKIMVVGTHAEESVRNATRALDERDANLARCVCEKDDIIDELEVDIEEECLKILALYQPVATDLRFIIAVLKINNDLERIGDLAVNVAERAIYLSSQPPVTINFDFHHMANITQSMLSKALDALVNADVELAREVCRSDDEVDNLNREMYLKVQEGGKVSPDQLELLIHMLSVSRHLERIADLATNIAEDVIYMARGEIVRHRLEDYLK